MAGNGEIQTSRSISRLAAPVAAWCLMGVSASAWASGEEAARQAMVAEIEADARETSLFIGKGALDDRVMAAMARVARHEFVPQDQRRLAYENRPLPIGHGQTISQPYIVALMTDLLDPRPDAKILEIGTGSGYQAAVLDELVSKVFTIEIIRPLGEGGNGRQIGRSGPTPDPPHDRRWLQSEPTGSSQ